ncbi:Nn.00g045200.m01.CDS01 [Neocucurbitaria sp. VM-36]
MDRGSIYDHDIPSLSASLEAFDPERSMHSAYSGRSNMNSSRWSVPQEEAESEAESDGPWAPPAWQKSHSSNHWYRKSLLSESAARSSPSRSPYEYRSDREVTPSRIPLPESPLKQTPRTSPEPISEEEQRYMPDNIASRMQSPSEEPQAGAGAQQGDEMALSHHEEAGQLDGFVRFAIRGETLFRTAPIEETISTFASGVHIFTRSRTSVACTLGMLILSWLLLQPWTAGLIPDVANVANMAKQFEPLMYASENVIPRSRELAEASIAVQDLGESVRATNMSASTVIIDQLDDLGDSLKVLSEKITSFFTNVDGDMDSILITMEWAKRELQSIQGPKIGMIDTVIGNIHGGLSKIGLLEHNGSPTAIGRVVNDVLGHTTQQRSKATLQRTFDYLLSTLEENIANELARADVLFQLFESVDRQFHNLHRSVAKEEDSLATKKDEFLASMWRMSINNKMKIKKYEKNLKLLKDVRASTLTNKSELKSHIQIIHSVKDQLDKARKNLISPLIRRAQSNSFGLEQQLNDLTGTYGFLKTLRDGQKKKVLQQLWGEPRRRVAITAGGGDEEIEEGEY